MAFPSVHMQTRGITTLGASVLIPLPVIRGNSNENSGDGGNGSKLSKSVVRQAEVTVQPTENVTAAVSDFLNR